jgi:hypothetical protein
MDTGNAVIDAQRAFSRERRRRRRGQAARWLTRRPRESKRLLSLEDALGHGPPAHRSRASLRTISLDSIVGTAEPAKAQVFDQHFRPLSANRQRWERLWMAGGAGAPVPPISVFQVGDEYFISDGHHRVSVAKALGVVAIDAEVTELDRSPLGLAA